MLSEPDFSPFDTDQRAAKRNRLRARVEHRPVARRNRTPATKRYLTASYYERWLMGMRRKRSSRSYARSRLLNALLHQALEPAEALEQAA